jgi:hypothetical protein
MRYEDERWMERAHNQVSRRSFLVQPSDYVTSVNTWLTFVNSEVHQASSGDRVLGETYSYNL